MKALELIIGVLNDNFLWLVLIYIFYMGFKLKSEWVQSIRSIATAMLTVAFVKLALTSKLDPKDVMLIVSLVYNFYFLAKKRSSESGENQDKQVGGIKQGG